FVILSAIVAQGKSKIFQNLVYKIIGLNKIKIIKASILEFLILYGITITFSIFFSIIISKFVVEEFFKSSWEFDFITLFSIIFFIIFL